MRISDWSSDVCSSDLLPSTREDPCDERISGFPRARDRRRTVARPGERRRYRDRGRARGLARLGGEALQLSHRNAAPLRRPGEGGGRSEEHTSELQSLMRISYAVFCLKKKKQ